MRRILISTVAAMALMAVAPMAVASVAASAVATAQSEDARLADWFETAYQARLALSPQQLTSMGSKVDYNKLDDNSPEAQARSLAMLEAQLVELKASFNPAALSAQNQLSVRLFEYQVEQARLMNQWRDWGFQFAANGNPTTSLPVFMINNHRVTSVSDAEAYVARLEDSERYMGQVAATLRDRTAKGIVSPIFVFEPSIDNTRAVISGAPFAGNGVNPVWEDFQKKVNALDTDQATKNSLLSSAQAALTGPYKRGFDEVLVALDEAKAKADSNDGVWRLPEGEAYYNSRLKFSTTTDLTADQIHNIGLAEVARIQADMEVIMRQVGFNGTLQEFFTFIKTDPQFQYPNTPEGKEAFLSDARGYVNHVMEIAPQWFSTLPKAALEVRAVEPFREATASIAFYNRPAPDGSRPGIYYMNLSDMTQVLKPQVEGISLHEGAPGHHFQIAYAQELEGVPSFRRFGGYGVYSEGWGLYSEQLGKEMGFYQDPYSDFGRLSTELWRAVRLVLDTGLHAKKWSREEAMEYFRQNSLLSERDIQKETERYITSPGQATSYKIGELKIFELRNRAQQALGDKFDIRDFHAVVLGNGAVPLVVLEEQVDSWIAAGGGAPRH